MIRGLMETIDPRKGRGLMESVIFILGLAVLFVLNMREIPVSKELDYMIKALIGYMGYMVGANKKDKIKQDKEG